MEDLNLYFIAFSVHKDREFEACAGYIFAKDEKDIQKLLDAHYGMTFLRMAVKVDITEGKILYGERWRELGK